MIVETISHGFIFSFAVVFEGAIATSREKDSSRK